MSAAVLSYTTVRAARNATSRKSQQESADRSATPAHVPRCVRMCIPEPIHAALAASDLREVEKLIVYDIVHECCTASVQGKAINSDLLAHMPGIGRRRRVIKKWLKSSPNFGFIPGRVDESADFFFVRGFALAERSISGKPLEPTTEGVQHNGDVVPCGVWCGPVVWKTLDFGLLDWMVQVAKEKLGWNQAEIEAKKAIEEIELVYVPESYEKLLKVALENIPVRPTRNAKLAAERAEKAREKAEKHVAMIRLFQRDPTANIVRKSGRLYSRLTSLPRWARRAYLKFTGGRSAESVDVRSCYPWGLAASLRQSRLRRGLCIESLNNLLDMIESGSFYETLAARAGMSMRAAKQSFAVLCLFGDSKKDSWGRNSLWFALDAICPELCDEIARWRRQPAGAVRFAMHCQRLEGAIMLNDGGLVSAMAELGIPCATIHDGCLVPEGYGALAAQIIGDRAASLFGRPCAVKAETI